MSWVRLLKQISASCDSVKEKPAQDAEDDHKQEASSIASLFAASTFFLMKDELGGDDHEQHAEDGQKQEASSTVSLFTATTFVLGEGRAGWRRSRTAR